MEIIPAFGVGVGDVQHALRAELARLLNETRGGTLAQSKVLVRMLQDRQLITANDAASVYRLAKISNEVDTKKRDAKAAYFEARDLYNTMLAKGEASPVALAIASSSVGAYSISESPDGSGVVVFAKRGDGWEARGTSAGAIIGAALGGLGGALIGSAVGGVVGAAVDECTK
jgi:hypothetical protein